MGLGLNVWVVVGDGEPAIIDDAAGFGQGDVCVGQLAQYGLALVGAEGDEVDPIG